MNVQARCIICSSSSISDLTVVIGKESAVNKVCDHCGYEWTPPAPPVETEQDDA